MKKYVIDLKIFEGGVGFKNYSKNLHIYNLTKDVPLSLSCDIATGFFKSLSLIPNQPKP